MNDLKRICVLAALVAAAAALAPAQRRLVAIGGGKRPPAAGARFVEWAGGRAARLLVVTWASAAPDESFAALRADFEKYPVAAFEQAPAAPLDAAARARFVEQLAAATGVFFAGGDQNRIMDALGDGELAALLRARYRAGVVFGGTSAGAAVLSTPMLTGENDLTVIDGAKVGTRAGLGLVPDVVFDQHFIRRQRENRLFGLVLRDPRLLGVGIDEDAALAVADDRAAEVFGAGFVMIVDARAAQATFAVHLLKAGDRFDLAKRKKIGEK